LFQARQGGGVLAAEKFIEFCKSFGAGGGQMDFAQLTSTEPDYLKRIRAALDASNMFLELSFSSRLLEDAAALGRACTAANQLGVTRLRIALLNGRRYEDFDGLKQWKGFVSHSKQLLARIEPILKQHRLVAGIENHKDWTADELVEILRRFSSPHLGACVDFGNNMALLEDSLEVARKLAPYAVTTHVKDMAVSPYDTGFYLSEVPLGEGVLPLAKMIDSLTKQRRDIHLCLEMITRDPLKVPYLEDKYWATYEARDNARIEKFKALVSQKAASTPLPRVTGLAPAEMLAAEDDNIRRSAAYARATLRL
jgi:sugar phosphate isomerase/epimerase